MQMLKVNVNPPYPIQFALGLLNRSLLLAIDRIDAARWVIITDETVAALYAQDLMEFLKGYCACDLITFAAGEQYKTRATKAKIEDQLMALACDRSTGIIALGGGVVTDLAGFVAATYMRGLPCIMIPTTLLAMVDASVGGKTAVNVPQGKNLIGIIQQPKAVLIDPKVLTTLEQQIYMDGFIETLKHALLADQDLWTLMNQQYEKLFARDADLLQQVIYRSIKIKADIVEQDEHEDNKRQLLNLGHTIGHAIEAATHYQVSHGQAVGYGLVIEAMISQSLGLMTANTLLAIRQTLMPYLLPSALDFTQIIPYLKADKKAKRQQPHFVLLRDIAKPWSDGDRYSQSVPAEVIKKVLGEFVAHC